MYMGGPLVIAVAPLFYRSWPLLLYSAIFVVIAHLFVLLYEEPTLRRTFGPEYEAYCQHVRRWLPRE